MINHYELCNDTIEYYNLGLYDYFHDMLDVNNGIEIDLRSFHLFYENKNLMLHRIAYLQKNNYLSNETILFDGFKKIVDSSAIILNLVVKCKILNNSEKVIKKILSLLRKIKLDEEEMTTKLIRELENHN